MKFVFHIDEIARWQVALSSVKNTVNYLKENHEAIEIELVVNSEAVQVLVPSISEAKGMEESFLGLFDSGVKVFACANALKASGLVKADLFGQVEVVPASMIHLAKRQGEGYAYIRP